MLWCWRTNALKVGLAGSRSGTKVVGGWTPRSDKAKLEEVALVKVTTNDVVEVDPVDEVVRVIEASVVDEGNGIDELVVVTALSFGEESADAEAIEVVDTGRGTVQWARESNLDK